MMKVVAYQSVHLTPLQVIIVLNEERSLTALTHHQVQPTGQLPKLHVLQSFSNNDYSDHTYSAEMTLLLMVFWVNIYLPVLRRWDTKFTCGINHDDTMLLPMTSVVEQTKKKDNKKIHYIKPTHNTSDILHQERWLRQG